MSENLPSLPSGLGVQEITVNLVDTNQETLVTAQGDNGRAFLVNIVDTSGFDPGISGYRAELIFQASGYRVSNAQAVRMSGEKTLAVRFTMPALPAADSNGSWQLVVYGRSGEIEQQIGSVVGKLRVEPNLDFTWGKINYYFRFKDFKDKYDSLLSTISSLTVEIAEVQKLQDRLNDLIEEMNKAVANEANREALFKEHNEWYTDTAEIIKAMDSGQFADYVGGLKRKIYNDLETKIQLLFADKVNYKDVAHLIGDVIPEQEEGKFGQLYRMPIQVNGQDLTPEKVVATGRHAAILGKLGKKEYYLVFVDYKEYKVIKTIDLVEAMGIKFQVDIGDHPILMEQDVDNPNLVWVAFGEGNPIMSGQAQGGLGKYDITTGEPIRVFYITTPDRSYRLGGMASLRLGPKPGSQLSEGPHIFIQYLGTEGNYQNWGIGYNIATDKVTDSKTVLSGANSDYERVLVHDDVSMGVTYGWPNRLMWMSTGQSVGFSENFIDGDYEMSGGFKFFESIRFTTDFLAAKPEVTYKPNGSIGVSNSGAWYMEFDQWYSPKIKSLDKLLGRVLSCGTGPNGCVAFATSTGYKVTDNVSKVVLDTSLNIAREFTPASYLPNTNMRMACFDKDNFLTATPGYLYIYGVAGSGDFQETIKYAMLQTKANLVLPDNIKVANIKKIIHTRLKHVEDFTKTIPVTAILTQDEKVYLGIIKPGGTFFVDNYDYGGGLPAKDIFEYGGFLYIILDNGSTNSLKVYYKGIINTDLTYTLSYLRYEITQPVPQLVGSDTGGYMLKHISLTGKTYSWEIRRRNVKLNSPTVDPSSVDEDVVKPFKTTITGTPPTSVRTFIKGFDCNGKDFIILLGDNTIRYSTGAETTVGFSNLGELHDVAIAGENFFIAGSEGLAVYNIETFEPVVELPAFYDTIELVRMGNIVLGNRSDGTIIMLESTGRLLAAHLPTVWESMPIGLGVSQSSKELGCAIPQKKVNGKETITDLILWTR